MAGTIATSLKNSKVRLRFVTVIYQSTSVSVAVPHQKQLLLLQLRQLKGQTTVIAPVSEMLFIVHSCCHQ